MPAHSDKLRELGVSALRQVQYHCQVFSQVAWKIKCYSTRRTTHDCSAILSILSTGFEASVYGPSRALEMRYRNKGWVRIRTPQGIRPCHRPRKHKFIQHATHDIKHCSVVRTLDRRGGRRSRHTAPCVGVIVVDDRRAGTFAIRTVTA